MCQNIIIGSVHNEIKHVKQTGVSKFCIEV